jgi:hypothetical protein
VLRGEKGTGKGTVGQVLARIFRDHALHVVHSRHLTGHFNAHLVDTLFLFLDEAFWGGDKQGEGVLKALVTERSVMIEPKGFDPFAMPNRLKILMASNNDWVVPATADERRYFVLDVSDQKRGDLAYFDRLHQALDEGRGRGLPRPPPRHGPVGLQGPRGAHTRGLNRQKLVGADSVTAFWNDCLREGVILGEGGTSWPADVVTQVLHACYLEHARDHGERHPLSDARMVERLEELWAGCEVRRTRPRAPAGETSRPQRYALASLERHREAFLKAMRSRRTSTSGPRTGRPTVGPIDRLSRERMQPREVRTGSRRVRRFYDRLLANDPNPFIQAALTTLTEKPSVSAAGQGGQGGRGGQVAALQERPRSHSPLAGRPNVPEAASFAHARKHQNYPDHPDHPDRTRKQAAFSPWATLDHPDHPDRRGWHSLDFWRCRWREAADVPSRREVLAAWAEAAGGEVTDGTLRLPSGLPRRLARAEMLAAAGCVGLAVAEVSPPRCAWCPEPSLPGDGLCDHCRWLAGPAPHPPRPGLSP